METNVYCGFIATRITWTMFGSKSFKQNTKIYSMDGIYKDMTCWPLRVTTHSFYLPLHVSSGSIAGRQYQFFWKWGRVEFIMVSET